ncbi:Cys-tRNA(Pro) deacylase [Methylobacterium dankookense]|uniref:Cys-tRNA(Pro)/Cys-tRNA(Cys) deacylase n=1 Tax=Methylobacterium dankookense TaxID=560405 RepID=A0A564FVQ7_9HYPH|nr:Cys-tRNA(Pro) deacylase [Methylobacterium dankookense]GJD55272.1 Cys-tRNA(Pro)/Cys-tRNA(Cys) deacylase YbaK [Methylobacterium dankookense]VUF11511.1 Cys-tRNA(Pro)/Cys-tRNA(Cys) deacylase YbaK [Methylobacterium dankookense]
MAKATPATRALDKAGIPYSLHAYAYDPDAPRIGLQAAEALGVGPDRVLKTLMAAVDGKPVCLLVASDREVSMKRVAAAFGGKSAAMLKPPEAERLTGYHVGGISPLGQKRTVPTLIDSGSLDTDEEIHVNGGGRGLQIRLRPADLVAVLQARTAALA